MEHRLKKSICYLPEILIWLWILYFIWQLYFGFRNESSSCNSLPPPINLLKYYHQLCKFNFLALIWYWNEVWTTQTWGFWLPSAILWWYMIIRCSVLKHESSFGPAFPPQWSIYIFISIPHITTMITLVDMMYLVMWRGISKAWVQSLTCKIRGLNSRYYPQGSLLQVFKMRIPLMLSFAWWNPIIPISDESLFSSSKCLDY